MLCDWGVSVQDLTCLARPHVRKLLAEGRVHQGPEAARRALANGGPPPDMHGDNVVQMRLLRDCIAITGGWTFANAVMISAPHTHWTDAVVAVWREPRRRAYTIGPVENAPMTARYAPVSFVFTGDGPQPHEWADIRKLQPQRDYWRVRHLIEALNGRLMDWIGDQQPFPLGVTLAARFKRLFDPPVVGTMEVPDTVGPLARIVRDRTSDQVALETGGQVGWSAHLMPAEATPADIKAAEQLGLSLRNLPEREAERVYDALRRLAAQAAA